MWGKSLSGIGLSLGRRLSKVVGFFSGARILWLVIPLLAGALGTSFWIGKRWSDGSHAVSDLADLNKKIERYSQAADKAYAAALKFEQTRRKIDAFYNQQDQEFRAFIEANRDRLSDCDIGPDGLRLWNQWNQGSAAPADPAQPDGGLSEGAAAGAQRQNRAPDGQP